jgi:hypothetical protein
VTSGGFRLGRLQSFNPIGLLKLLKPNLPSSLKASRSLIEAFEAYPDMSDTVDISVRFVREGRP